MTVKTLDEIREDEIESFLLAGDYVLATDFGMRPLTHEDWRDHHDYQREPFFCSAALAKHALWMLVQRRGGHRAVHVTWIWQFDDGCRVAGREWEGKDVDHTAVPLSIIAKLTPDDSGAHHVWRQRVNAYWQERRSTRTLDA